METLKMTENKTLVDDFGIIYEAQKILIIDKLKIAFLGALAELENNECYKTQTFPVTRLHRVVGYEQKIYRADIDKISGWRIHIQHIDGKILLKDIVEGQKHDDVIKVIKAKKGRYE